ncbi:MAG TPA: prolyl-tRNA synthetase associated domain-containing protein [Patescibacteria group bacterium]
MENVYQTLDLLGIKYKKFEHPMMHTVEDADKLDFKIPGGVNKCLFLRNKKGDKHYLVLIKGTKRLDLKNLEKLLNEARLSFASPERLMKYLRITPGSVSPFGLINDLDKVVVFIVDNELLAHEQIALHPNINTQTLVLKTEDFRKFLAATKNKILFPDL